MISLFLGLLLVMSAQGLASEFDFDEDFSDTPSKTDEKTASSETVSLPFRFYAGLNLGRQTGKPVRWISQSLDLNTVLDWASSAGVIYGEANMVWNRAYRKESDPQETIDAWEKQGIVRELYWSSTFGALSLIAGRQIVVTGKGDFLSVLDLISPSDQSQLFFADPEDARLGQNLIRLDAYPVNGHNFSLLYSPQAVNNRLVNRGHPYQSLPEYKPESRQLREWSAVYRFNRDQLELSLMGGLVHQRIPLLKMDPLTGQLQGSWNPFHYSGLAMTWSTSGWLLKAELAAYRNYGYQGISLTGAPKPLIRDVRAAMAGFDYQHSDLGTLTVEGNIMVPEEKNSYAKTRSLYAFAWNKAFLNDDLTFSLSHLGFDRMANQLNRAGASFRLDDTWSLEQLYTHISIQDEDFRSFENMDRYDITLKAGFGF